MQKLQITEISTEMPLLEQIEKRKENLLHIRKVINQKMWVNGRLHEVHDNHKKQFELKSQEQLNNLLLAAQELGVEDRKKEIEIYDWVVDNQSLI